MLPVQRTRLPMEEALRYVELVAGGIERGTRAVLKNPWLLFGLIGVSLLARLLFAPPNKQKSYRAPASPAAPEGAPAAYAVNRMFAACRRGVRSGRRNVSLSNGGKA